MTSQPNPVDDQSMRALTDELAHLVLNEVAPEELALYPETAEEYYADTSLRERSATAPSRALPAPDAQRLTARQFAIT